MQVWGLKRCRQQNTLDDDDEPDETFEAAVRNYRRKLFEKDRTDPLRIPSINRPLLRKWIAYREDALFIERVMSREMGTGGVFGIGRVLDLMSTIPTTDITSTEVAVEYFVNLFALYGFVKDGQVYVRDPLAFEEGRILPFEPQLFIDLISVSGETPRLSIYLHPRDSETQLSLVKTSVHRPGQWIWENFQFSLPNLQEGVRISGTTMSTGIARIKLSAELAFTGTHGQIVQPATEAAAQSLQGRSGMIVYVEDDNGVGHEIKEDNLKVGQVAKIGVVNSFSAIHHAPGLYEAVVKGGAEFKHGKYIYAAPPTEIEIMCLADREHPKAHLEMTRRVSPERTAECFINLGMIEAVKRLDGGCSVTFMHKGK